MTSRIIVIPGRRAHSNHAEVARTIGVDIIAGRYPEGAKLPGDAELTVLFGVSRPVLRESVKTLVAKGLLSTKARVGTVVRERSAWNMFDHDVLAWHLDAGIDPRVQDCDGDVLSIDEPGLLACGLPTDLHQVPHHQAHRRRRGRGRACFAARLDEVADRNARCELHIRVLRQSG